MEKLLDKFYLQATTKDFYDMLDQNHKGREYLPNEKMNSQKLLNDSKQAFKRGNLDVAEKFVGKAIQRQKIEDASSEINPELYYHLAEVLQQKATKATLEQLERQKLLLQATALYMFVRNCFNKSSKKSELVMNISKCLPQKILDVQHSIIQTASGNPSTCKFNSESKQKALKELREEAKASLEEINDKYDAETGSDEDLREMFIKQTPDVKILFKRIATRVKQLFVEIIEECFDVLGKPPCDYEVMLLGSLAREEMTPYSDIEWAILTNSEEEKCKTFFRTFTNLVNLQIIMIGETILPCMDIKVLRGDWFYDDVTPRGLSFDAFLPQACKTPLGNAVDFELIHTPKIMAIFQSNYWHKNNPHLGDILLTVAPLQNDKQTLLNEYKKIVEKILREPCDLENCTHSNTVPTKGSCRGHSILLKDVTQYGQTMLEIDQAKDGKLYDVKKEIYRLTDRVIAGLSKVFRIATNGSFKVLGDLYERNVICSIAKDNLSSAVAIALKFRLSTYLLAEKQAESMDTSSNNCSDETVIENNGLPTYDITRKNELFHFFFVSNPLYELLREFSAGNRMRSEDLVHNSFFDCCDINKGHMHCRLLNYVDALEYYKRGLKVDPENIDLKIRRLRIEYHLSKSSNIVLSSKEELNALRQEISERLQFNSDDFVRPKSNKATEATTKKGKKKLLSQLVDVHIFHVSCCMVEGEGEMARASLEQCKSFESEMNDLQKLSIRLTLLYISETQVTEKEFDEIMSLFTVLIKKFGSSITGLTWLNELGKSLLYQERFVKARQCLQRAMLMGRILFGYTINFQVLKTLSMLANVCFRLKMYEEAKLYSQLILNSLHLSKVHVSVSLKREVFHRLAMINNFTGNFEDAILYFKKALNSNSRGKCTDFMEECLIHCGLSTTYFKVDKMAEALRSAFDAKGCLVNIPNKQYNVLSVCLVSKTFMEISKNNEAMQLLKQDLPRNMMLFSKRNI
ncbi:uncharacterized protein LOC124448481 [Xenia sp. Carnegie-2017]|uniref:uncharacterized protein LOC124448481 n=1 Tax=Xenia sp. Carnegie-2017 TaxID=2897299 RepID=UPI001F03D1B3|nr:uncharacterized protein LOC124448481 [Xenia sp. Carnegie-2017]